MTQQDDTGFALPEWIVLLVGRLTIENEGLRQSVPAPVEPPAAPTA